MLAAPTDVQQAVARELVAYEPDSTVDMPSATHQPDCKYHKTWRKKK